MTAFTYRMPAGVPGIVSRAEQATVEAGLYDSAAPFPTYGLPGKIAANGKFQPIGAGDAMLYGILVKPYPTNSSQDGLGVSAPPASGICNILRRGYIMAQVNGGGTPAKGAQVYVRIATPAAGKPIGGFEAAADGANTIAPAGLTFMGPPDATGNTELAFNI